jgi:hypothetical protein
VLAVVLVFLERESVLRVAASAAVEPSFDTHEAAGVVDRKLL